VKVESQVIDDLQLMLEVLPDAIKRRLESQAGLEQLLEVVLDLGRRAEARFPNHSAHLGEEPVSQQEIQHVVDRVGEFGGDNRAGIQRTLHRISAIRNRVGRVVGLTCRVGRSVYGTVDIIRDIVETGKNILLLGRPGIGKTTKLREVARVLADEFGKRVIVVDTSNEIAGDGDIPHPGIGAARRMQVPRPDLQHAVMIEAVENHMPEVIVIDEISAEAEALAARTIAERGVQLVATAHGNTLENLLMNPSLCDLIGGVHAVTLSDEEARRRETQKTVLERKAPPTFDIVVEIMEIDRLAIHHDVASTVDWMLAGQAPNPEIRLRSEDGSVEVVAPQEMSKQVADRPLPAGAQGRWKRRPGVMRIFPYGVSRGKLERAFRDIAVAAQIVNILEDADAVLALRAHERRDSSKLSEAADRGIPVTVIRSNTYAQVAAAVRELRRDAVELAEHAALEEARQAIERVVAGGGTEELSPHNAYIRRLQHRLANQHGLRSESVGVEPWRRARISR